jgi:hypothetical protein
MEPMSKVMIGKALRVVFELKNVTGDLANPANSNGNPSLLFGHGAHLGRERKQGVVPSHDNLTRRGRTLPLADRLGWPPPQALQLHSRDRKRVFGIMKNQVPRPAPWESSRVSRASSPSFSTPMVLPCWPLRAGLKKKLGGGTGVLRLSGRPTCGSESRENFGAATYTFHRPSTECHVLDERKRGRKIKRTTQHANNDIGVSGSKA